MIRKVVIPEQAQLSIPLPASYVGKEVEVLAFVLENEMQTSRKKDMKFDEFSIDTSGFKFDREEANAR